MRSLRGLDIAMSFLAGSVIGAGVVLFATPITGQKAREMLRKSILQLMEDPGHGHEIRVRVEEAIQGTKSKAKEIGDKIRRKMTFGRMQGYASRVGTANEPGGDIGIEEPN